MICKSLSSNFNSCRERLCEKKGQTLSKDDSYVSHWPSTWIIYLKPEFSGPLISGKLRKNRSLKKNVLIERNLIKMCVGDF